jgi:hypothetical protein
MSYFRCLGANRATPDKELLRVAKIGIEPVATKIFLLYLGALYFGVYKVLSCTTT